MAGSYNVIHFYFLLSLELTNALLSQLTCINIKSALEQQLHGEVKKNVHPPFAMINT